MEMSLVQIYPSHFRFKGSVTLLRFLDLTSFISATPSSSLSSPSSSLGCAFASRHGNPLGEACKERANRKLLAC
jgi:hypothetical protein